MPVSQVTLMLKFASDNTWPQDYVSMADGQFALPRYSTAHRLGRHILRLQGSRGHFRSLHGYRCHIWSYGRHHGEGHQSVPVLFSSFEGVSLTLACLRAYPKSGMFAVCQPDVPCITPGTYALLGAAAALRYVASSCPEVTVTRTANSGIMRLTVTVVVIMFELTGALTYILPTMVSLAYESLTLR